jgi:predicted aminopeptidase
VDFNEELAEFIGSEGARLYIEERFTLDSDEYKSIFTSKENSLVLINFLQKLIAELDAMYNDVTLSRDEKLSRKQTIIAAYKKTFRDDYDTMFSNDNYKSFADVEINNAFLELYRLYYSPENYFKALYEKYNCSLQTYIRAAKTLKGTKAKDKQTLLGLLEDALKKEASK